MWKATIAAASLLMGAVPAAAAMFKVEIEGKVDYGTGPSGDPLNLTPFSAALVFDPALGGRQTDRSGILILRDRIYGGSGYTDYPASPFVSGTFTVDGATIALTGSYDTSIEADYADDGRNSYTATIVGDTSQLRFTVYGEDLQPPLDRGMFALGLTNSDNNFTSQGVTANGVEIYILKTTVLAGLGPSPVPEPASWALMITGLGAAGVMLRRRHTAARC